MAPCKPLKLHSPTFDIDNLHALRQEVNSAAYLNRIIVVKYPLYITEMLEVHRPITYF